MVTWSKELCSTFCEAVVKLIPAVELFPALITETPTNCTPAGFTKARPFPELLKSMLRFCNRIFCAPDAMVMPLLHGPILTWVRVFTGRTPMLPIYEASANGFSPISPTFDGMEVGQV